MGDVLVPFVNCVVVLTGDGQRVLAKYYDKRSDEEQVKAETTFHKVRSCSAQLTPPCTDMRFAVIVARSDDVSENCHLTPLSLFLFHTRNFHPNFPPLLNNPFLRAYSHPTGPHSSQKTKHNKYSHDTDVLLTDGEVVTYRCGSDCKLFLSSTADENELVLAGVLDAIYDTLSLLFHGQMDHRTILDNLELVLLTIDEVVSVVIIIYVRV